MFTVEKLQEMKIADIMEIDRKELADIMQIEIDEKKPIEERIRDYIEQVGNPYIVKVGEYVVQFKYMDCKKSMEQKMKEYIAKLASIHWKVVIYRK